MSAPSTTDWAALELLVRYLILRPRCVYHFAWQDEGAVIRAYVDTDFAGRLRTRRPTCSGACLRGQAR
eukprot:15450353-Alexandrium_andersonii.AAC.1